MKTIVISQPMLFPWVGMFEQIRLADVYVYYSDVQFSKGSFVNRVQIKSSTGIRWLTVPLRNLHLGQRIDEVLINNDINWRKQHLDLLCQAYANSPFFKAMINLVESVYKCDFVTLNQISEASVKTVCEFFELDIGRKFIASKELGIGGSSSRRVLDIVLTLGGDRYVTGLGALNYLDHELFDKNGIDVQYMNYKKLEYPQQHGLFTPFVSILDLVANCGKAGHQYICSGSQNWRHLQINT